MIRHLRIALTAALLAAAAQAGAAGAKAPPEPLPAAAPAALGLSAERLDRLRDHFRAEAAHDSAAGYVLMVARDGKLAYSAALGLRDRERQLPMTLDTRFRIASMTKPVTAVAVLMLYEAGRFQLDDPVSRFLPEFTAMRVFTGSDEQGVLHTEPAKGPITIRHLLTHTSGLGYGAGYDPTGPLGKAFTALNLADPGTLADRVRSIATVPLYSHPGEAWRYSFASDVLGRLVEVVGGMPFDRFLRTHLFEPLGMRHTGFYLPAADGERLATLYRHGKNGELVRSDVAPFNNPHDANRYPSGGGGLISTAGDYLRFAQMLANQGSFEGRQYLSPVTVRLMTANHVPEDAMVKYWGANSRGLGYGFGVGVIIDAAAAPQADLNGDYSWGGLLDTHWIVSPRTGIVAVLLAQVDPRSSTVPQRTYADFRNLLFAAVKVLDRPPVQGGR